MERFVGLEDERLVAPLHLRFAAHHHPVLAAVPVRLQRQGFARRDADPLHQKAVAGLERLGAAPGPVDGRVLAVFASALRLQSRNGRFDVLHARLVRDQHGIGGLHHHRAVEADGGEQAVLGGQVGVSGVDGEHVAGDGVAVGVRFVREHVRQRPPGAHVAPGHVRRHDSAAIGLLHHGVVD